MSESTDATFAARVKLQRDALKMSQSELAEAVEKYGLSFQSTTIHKIEKGTRRVTIAEAVGLAHALRVSLHELLDRGVDSAFVAKEVLLEYGMETLLDHERVIDSMMPMIARQKRMARFIADYRDRFGEDPLWLAYSPEHQDLRAHWEPLVNWTGPRDYLESWRKLIESTGDRYLNDLGWADDRADPDWIPHGDNK